LIIEIDEGGHQQQKLFLVSVFGAHQQFLTYQQLSLFGPD
jgi:hypothetical protein